MTRLVPLSYHCVTHMTGKHVARRSPTLRLLAGLLVTLSAVAVYSGFTIWQLRQLRQYQAAVIDRNRADSLVLLRIQNNLNTLALAMRDMLDSTEGYPLSAWRAQFRRIRTDLDDALAKERQFSGVDQSSGQREYLQASVAQFWEALDRILNQAAEGQEAEARTQIRLSLQARQEALSSAVARLLVQNNESEQQAASRTREIYGGVERNVYIFAAAMVILIVLTSLYLVGYNRRLFDQVADLSERRSELAQQLISLQENTFRSISRDLHDDFGQILTAIGVMLQRLARRNAAEAKVEEELRQVQEIVQATLEKVRTLSHALHPVVLDEVGLESALQVYLPAFEKQTGIAVHYSKSGPVRELSRDVAIQVYRVIQESLNNTAKHAQSHHANIRMDFLSDRVIVEIEDDGVGFQRGGETLGLGLVSMRERAGLMAGKIEFLDRTGGGALVRLTIPLAVEEAHAGV